MPLSEDEFLNEFQEVDPYEFERFVGKLWELQNWDTHVTKGADDGGIDLIAERSTPFRKKQAIQVKRYESSNAVGRPEIQQYSSIKQERVDVDTVVVVTTSHFTDGAKEVAKKLNVKLIPGSQLYNLVDALDAFELAQWYIDPEAVETDPNKTEPKATHAESKETEQNPISIADIDEDGSPETVPKLLPNLIELRGNITDQLQELQTKVESAEEAFEDARYSDAATKYEQVNERRVDLRRDIVRYDAGLTNIDDETLDILPSTVNFSEQLTQMTEPVDRHSREAFRIVEKAKALDVVQVEIQDRLEKIIDLLDVGDRMRSEGEIVKSFSKYEQAKQEIQQLSQSKQLYEDMMSAYDDEVVQSHGGPTEEVPVSDLESEVGSRLDSKEKVLRVPEVSQNALGSFDPRVLTGYRDELFDNELIDYVEENEKLEFVFKPSRKGFKIVSSAGTDESPRFDTTESGACFLLITDEKIFYVAGVEDHDETQAIEYDQLSEAITLAEGTSNGFHLISKDGTKYEFKGLRDNAVDIEPAVRYVAKKID